MAQDVSASFSVVAEEQVPWVAHPRFAEVLMKPMLTSAANPLASVSRVRAPPGGVIGSHQHATPTETVYVLAGESTLTLDETLVPFGAGHIVAIPAGLKHRRENAGPETVELLCIFMPPIA